MKTNSNGDIIISLRDCKYQTFMTYKPSEVLLQQVSKSFLNAGISQQRKGHRRKEKVVEVVDEYLDMFAD